MPMIKLSDIVTPLTMFEARDAWYRVLARVGVAVTAWEPGAVVRTWTIAGSALLSALSEQQAEIAKAGFLEFASDTWLKIKAKYDYNVIAEDATFATGVLTMQNLGGGIYNGGAGDLVVRNSVSGKTYRNVASFELAASSVINVPIIALEAGSASNANTGEITEYVSEPLQRVELSNLAPLVARDAESAAEIRARCSEKLGSLSPMGPWDAYSYAARIAKLSTGESAGVTRTRVTRDGYGNVYLYVASASGGIVGTVGDTATLLGAVDESVQQNAAPLGDTAHVISATPVVITVSYRVWIRKAGMSTGIAKQTVAAALSAFMATHPIGGVKLGDEVFGHVFAEAITATVHGAIAEIMRVELVSPASDVELQPGEVPVLLHDPDIHAEITTVATEGFLQ